MPFFQKKLGRGIETIRLTGRLPLPNLARDKLNEGVILSC